MQEAVAFARHGQRARMQAADINHALQLRDVDQMHGFGASDRRRYGAVAGATDVFYIQDALHNCDDLIYEPLPRPPVEVGVLAHWFLVEGVKPRTPENAVPRQLLERTRAPARPPLHRLLRHRYALMNAATLHPRPATRPAWPRAQLRSQTMALTSLAAHLLCMLSL
jgi:TATA box binding protein associated factor (TAF)